MRVLNCSGSGSFSGVIAGIDWVTYNHSGPSVANMSLGGGFSQPVNDAVTKSIAYGVTYAVAAGSASVTPYERVVYLGTPAYYRLQAYAYNGAGSFDVWANHPA